MIRLIKIELYKILYYKTFWIILGLYLLLFIPSAYGLEGIVKSININGENLGSGLSIFKYPNVWYNMAYLAGWFKLILAVLIIILISNEYSYRTLRQNIIDGMSKWEVIWAKEIIVIIISLIASIFLAGVTIALGDGSESSATAKGPQVLLAYFLALLIYFNFAFLLASLFKKAGLSIGILILYTIIIENLISWKLPEQVSQLLPMNIIEQLQPNPFRQLSGGEVMADLSPVTLGMSFVYIALFLVIVRMRYKNV